jgi:hypothetical protein
VKAEKAMSLSGEPQQKWNSWDQLMQEKPQANLRLTPCALRLTVEDLRYALYDFWALA